ncbi:B-cell receptor CD22-like [Mytilus trossulus]|uniref:B-cell receptor CD22-like n=1 Tax=Mytilus trossulus TaxID=6551 RepID=UPI003004AE8D
MSAKVIMVVIHVLSSSTMALAQNVSIFPKTPAFVDVNHELTFMCKSSADEDWRNTLFFDETEDDGLSSVGLFYQNTNGTCIQSIISEKYQAACDIAKVEFNLTIRKIDRQYHDKIISCKTQFGNGTIEDISVTKTVKIYVKVPVSDIILSETEIETNVTSNFTIRCSVISRPAAIIKWIRFNADGLQDDITSFSQVSSNHSIAGDTIMSVLTIKFSKFDNKGHLQCEANNSFSFRQSQDIPLHIYYPPENRPIIRQVKPGPVDSGETVYLHCSVYGGYPIAKIIWDCQGKIKDQSSDTLSAVILELVIDRSYDDKICSCTATHRDPSYKHTLQHKLIVYYNPEVKFENNVLELYAVEGENLTVKCLANGNPKAMVHWEESNIELTVPEDSQSVLYIYRIERHQHLFTCHAVSLSAKYGQLVTSKPIEIEIFCKILQKLEKNMH